MRCNCGFAPMYLADQHLIAEQCELLMICGMLRKNNYQPKSPIPAQFKLGTGHMLFWVDKLIYLKRRHEAVKEEVGKRGFKITDKEIVLSEFPKKFCNDWQPSMRDSQILRERLVWKIEQKPTIWRYWRKSIVNINNYIKTIKTSKLCEV
jgi:deoxyribonuclease (pyrimidine dimer)